MFQRILIANRGEIACRVIDTAHRLGVSCVAVYSDADAGSRHVEMADLAVHIGGSVPTDSYLRGDVIIQAALDNGAQAIHPGYGFLSENPDFVEAVEKAGLIFIGPSPDAIRAMGLKDAAKGLMEKAGVPVVPGYHGQDQNDAHLAKMAEKIGYPVLIKAVAGGGGKGMRLVPKADEFDQALVSARAEAAGAFGNDDVLVEKYVEKPRHIEVQVFGDGTDAVHLYERDCSLQRRHQKVIEEAPAPGMTQEMRSEMGNAAVLAARAIGYKGAGTVEFIVDASDGLRVDRFWFMEMNTRLQVEHPVTEAVTGIDLVEWQLRVAAGEALPRSQNQIGLTGHAFEARLYAEDAENDFLPATGTLKHLRFPNDIRIDTGVREGDVISPFYDPMIAKITTHGATREIALLQLSAALDATQVAGTTTNLSFLGRLSRDPDFVAGDVDTGLIARQQTPLTMPRAPDRTSCAAAAIIAAGLDQELQSMMGFSLWAPLSQTITLRKNDEPIEAVLSFNGPSKLLVELASGKQEFHRVLKGWVSACGRRVEGRDFGDKVVVFAGDIWEFDVVDLLDEASGVVGDGNSIEAPMPGLVKAVYATPGQKVVAGDRLAVLEAMKMEHAMIAPRDGVVAEVFAHDGDQVEAGTALIRLEDET